MKSFDYIPVRTVEEAVSRLAEAGPEARPIAGGTELLVRMKRGLSAPRVLVDLAGIRELHGIDRSEAGLRIGSLVTHEEISLSPLVREYAPALAAACASVGSPQTRHLGTIGGNLASGVPSMDGAPPLLVLGTRINVAGTEGRRTLELESLFTGARQTALAPAEILTGILIPEGPGHGTSRFLKFGRRRALSLSLVNAAACLTLDSTNGRIVDCRLALGAVAPIPMRARQAEAFLQGREPTEAVLAEAGELAAGEARPIDDLRASADYRRDLIRVLVRRVLDEARC